MEGWKLFLYRESSDLLAGANTATSAFAKTGLYPFNPLSDTWDDAIETLGCDIALDQSKKPRTQWEVKIITSEEGRPELTPCEIADLQSGWMFEDKVGEIASADPLNNVLLIAKMRGDGILHCPPSNLNAEEDLCGESFDHNLSYPAEKGIAYKRPDGQWYVCISNRNPTLATQQDLMDPRKYFVTPVGSTMTSRDYE